MNNNECIPEGPTIGLFVIFCLVLEIFTKMTYFSNSSKTFSKEIGVIVQDLTCMINIYSIKQKTQFSWIAFVIP